MYYLSARHYDPATRQFLSKDLSRNDGEQSAYQYCLGNPVKNWDPTGMCSWNWLKKIGSGFKWLGNKIAAGGRAVGRAVTNLLYPYAKDNYWKQSAYRDDGLSRFTTNLIAATNFMYAPVAFTIQGSEDAANGNKKRAALNGMAAVVSTLYAGRLFGASPLLASGPSLATGVVGTSSASAAGSSGSVVQVNEVMSARSAAYQSQVTGLPPGTAYLQNGVKFDGINNSTGALLEAKGPGYAPFVENGSFLDWWRGSSGLVDQANRQLAAAEGAPIEWYFAEQTAANAAQRLLQNNGIQDISIFHLPPAQ
jgi:Restriction endonuclease fold toxin 5